jgi:flagellar biosynthesis anti-sigma factor FlgM
MKVSRGASHTLQQTQAQADAKNIKGSRAGKKSSAAMNNNPLSAQVSLSQQAQQIKKATDIAKQDSVDEKKIAYFQNLIDNGKYNVDSAKVADSLIDDHMKMPN